MGMLVLILLLITFGTLIYFIFNRDWYLFWTYYGLTCLAGFFVWLFIGGLIGVMASSTVTTPVGEEYIQHISKYNIVSLHHADPSYPENMYIESYEDSNGYNKYKFAYESSGAYYTKVISPSYVVLGYCVEGVNPSIEYLDIDFNTKFSRFIFFDTFPDYYNIKIPFGGIYIRPNN